MTTAIGASATASGHRYVVNIVMGIVMSTATSTAITQAADTQDTRRLTAPRRQGGRHHLFRDGTEHTDSRFERW
jgi:hypothetical protein